MPSTRHDIPSSTPHPEEVRPDSGILDYNPFSTTDGDWWGLKQRAKRRAVFRQLFVITGLDLVDETRVSWKHALDRSFDPSLDQQEFRYTAMQALSGIADSIMSGLLNADSNVSELLNAGNIWTGEQAQAFLRPILPATHEIFRTNLIRLPKQRVFKSASFRDVSLALDSIGLPLDCEKLLFYRSCIHAIVPRQHSIGTASILADAFNIFGSVQAELGNEFDPHDMAVIVLCRTQGFAALSSLWAHQSEAENCISDLPVKFHQSRSQRNRLGLLVVGYTIHRHVFGIADTTENTSYTFSMPTHLSQKGAHYFVEAMNSYAQIHRLESTLQILAPRNNALTLSPEKLREWEEHFGQNYPPRWEENLPSIDPKPELERANIPIASPGSRGTVKRFLSCSLITRSLGCFR